MSLPLAPKNTQQPFTSGHQTKKFSDKENMNSKKIIFYIGDTQSDDTIINFTKNNTNEFIPTKTNKTNKTNNIINNTEPIVNNIDVVTIANNIETVQCNNTIINMVMYILNLVF